ncbi:hypothetical protein Tco_0802895 [Tanacetum coccineum]|uniref:Uncharacterized protein n=1 Tax=Tanacetum coccineum TaxID=301880 RepID=A0ABQ5A112_9ASTR
MYYPRFTKVIVNFFMTKDQSISKRNKVNWYFSRDDYMFTMIKVVFMHEDTQLYGAILPDKLTNEAIKDSESYKEYYAIALGAEQPKTKASVKKKQVGSDKSKTPTTTKGKRLKTSTKAAKTAKKKQPAKTSKAKGLTVLSEVALTEVEQMKLATKRSLIETHSSHANDLGADEGTDDDGQYDKDQDDVNEHTNLDNNGDDFVHPKLSTQDQEVRHNEEESDEESNEEIQGANVEEKELDEEATNDEDEANELYRDVNVNLEGQDIEMTDAQQTKYVPVTTIAELPLLSATILPPPPTPLITHLQQTLVPTPTTILSSSLQDLPNFAVSSIPGIVDAYLANKMHKAIKTAIQLQSDRLRDEAQAKNEDFINKLDDNIKKIIKDQVKEQVKAQVSKILPKIEKTVNEQLEAEVLTRSSNKSKTSHVVAANLSELELKKILIDKMENTVSFERCRDDEDKDEEPSAGSTGGQREEKLEKNQSQPVHQRKIPPRQLASLLKGTNLITRDTKDKPDEETSQHPDWFQKPAKPHTPDHNWNKTLPAAHGPVQSWLSTLAQKEDTRESFNELIDTPLDFSAFVMNRLIANTMTLELLAGPIFELMKGSCNSLVELEYFFEEVYKATTDQLDWNNPKGQQYPHDLRKPLPLIPNSQGRQVIPFDHFINNDLAYLSGGVSSRTYTTSVMKTKAADYGHIKWIEDLVPNRMWSQVPVSYDKHALWGISHWGKKQQQFYGFATNRESARDVYSKHDDKLYTFKEGDFNRLCIQDIEDMLLLLVQGKLTNLTVEERLAFNVSL